MSVLCQTAYSVESARDNFSGQASTVTTEITKATSSLVSTVAIAASREVNRTNVTTVVSGRAATPSVDSHGIAHLSGMAIGHTMSCTIIV